MGGGLVSQMGIEKFPSLVRCYGKDRTAISINFKIGGLISQMHAINVQAPWHLSTGLLWLPILPSNISGTGPSLLSVDTCLPSYSQASVGQSTRLQLQPPIQPPALCRVEL